MTDEIISGADILGALVMGHPYRSWWCCSDLDIEESRRLVPHQNATTMQVAISVVAACMWMLENPGRGLCVPDDLPHDYVLDISRPYLGKFISVASDWNPLKHYSNFFRYMEVAEHDFFRSLGFSVVTNQVDPPVGWPRVHAECDYQKPLQFEDEVEIHMLVSEKKSKSLSYVFRFRKLNATPPVEVARGSLTVVCVTHQHGKMSAAAIPKIIADKIEVAPNEMLAS